ncbi:helix-turn-helix domain-containing protein (plasmid) [Priestia megaterium NCT-2]|nr:helix-turn-helix domain-containing protein [Priestia megaterium NCT-2]
MFSKFFIYFLNGQAKAIRFSTLEAICKALECQPNDTLEYRSDKGK